MSIVPHACTYIHVPPLLLSPSNPPSYPPLIKPSLLSHLNPPSYPPLNLPFFLPQTLPLTSLKPSLLPSLNSLKPSFLPPLNLPSFLPQTLPPTLPPSFLPSSLKPSFLPSKLSYLPPLLSPPLHPPLQVMLLILPVSHFSVPVVNFDLSSCPPFMCISLYIVYICMFACTYSILHARTIYQCTMQILRISTYLCVYNYTVPGVDKPRLITPGCTYIGNPCI